MQKRLKYLKPILLIALIWLTTSCKTCDCPSYTKNGDKNKNVLQHISMFRPFFRFQYFKQLPYIQSHPSTPYLENKKIQKHKIQNSNSKTQTTNSRFQIPSFTTFTLFLLITPSLHLFFTNSPQNPI